MKVFVLITAAIELLAGAVMFLAPDLIPDFAKSSGVTQMYGAAALAMGFFALQTWQHMGSQVIQKAFLQTFTLFHFGVSAAGYMGYSNGDFSDPTTCILHLLLGLITAYFLFQKRTSAAKSV